MNVLLSKKFMPSDIDYLTSRLDPSVSLVNPATYDEAGVLEKLADCDVLLGGMITRDILQAGSHLKLMQIPWTGVDNIDLSMLADFSIPVCNSHSNGMVVAEHAVGLLMSMAKSIPYHDRQMRQGQWNRVSPAGNEVSPFSARILNGKLTLVGYGAVNQWVHRLLSGFELQVNVVTRSGKIRSGVQNEALQASTNVFGLDKLHEALADADFVVTALPLTNSSKGMIDATCFEAMGSNCILVNVGRGSLVDPEALYHALQTGVIRGAGIDTWYNYPKPGEKETFPALGQAFHELNNLVLSPHRAGYVNAGFPHLDDAIDNINRVAQGAEPVNRLSIELGY